MKILFKTVILATLSVAICSNTAAKAQKNEFFGLSDQFFKTYVDKTGNVDYKALVKEKALLNKLADLIANYELKGVSTAEIKAFYTNTYNILVIKQIVDRYPIKGPLAVSGFFDRIKNKVAGEQLTLNQVEKDKNLYTTGDERLHFALVCGAKGCPPLANFAFTPENIESQLEDRTYLALNNNQFIRENGAKTEISQIFSWYKADFENKNFKDIKVYLNKYRKNQIPEKSKIVYYEYDWNLNIQ